VHATNLYAFADGASQVPDEEPLAAPMAPQQPVDGRLLFNEFFARSAQIILGHGFILLPISRFPVLFSL
jgi:hypothetical protein